MGSRGGHDLFKSDPKIPHLPILFNSKLTLFYKDIYTVSFYTCLQQILESNTYILILGSLFTQQLNGGKNESYFL